MVHLKAVAGGTGGSWFVLMEGIAKLVRELLPEIQIEVVAGGGVENHATVGLGLAHLGILNPPMTAAAIAGETPYNRPYPDLRIGICNLTLNHLHCCVENSLPLDSVDDWIQRRYPLRFPVDRVGTVDRLAFRHLLSHYGLSESDIKDWGCELIEAANYGEQLQLFRDGRVNALWQFMGVPSPSILAAHGIRPLKTLTFPDSYLAAMAAKGWAAATMPPSAYHADGREARTISMATTIGFHRDVPDDIVFSIVKLICERGKRLGQIHPAAAHFRAEKAHINGMGPMHPGAERYFRPPNFPAAGKPEAEFPIDLGLVQRLLSDQFPELAALPLRLFGSGWDNAVFRLGSELCVRIPRHASGAELIRNEQKWLPRIAQTLPLPVPVPHRVGTPTGYFPWSWSVVPWIEGHSADEAPLLASQASVFGNFLRCLHAGAEPDFPRNPHRGIALAEKDKNLRERLGRVSAELGTVAKILLGKWERAISVNIDTAPRLLHGDLHPLNLLSRDGIISGIIDWGDLCAGDIATDLAAAWMLFRRASQRKDFFAAYGAVTDATLARAEGWAIFFGVFFFDTGLANNPRQAGLGRKILKSIAG